MDPMKVVELKAFVEACKEDPALLADPSLAFFRDYLASLGAELSQAASASKPACLKVSSMENIDEPMQGPTLEPDELDEDIVESDLELDGVDIVEHDHGDTPQKMGDTSVEVTEESQDASQEAKGLAMEAMSEGKLEKAVEHLTKAIVLNPTSAIMYGSRAYVFIKMKKPAAAIRDANAALEINPDCAKGYKSRGMANAMLGNWEDAASDLHAASNIDYDDEINAVLKKVEPNAHKIVEHRRKYDRLRKERKEKKAERDPRCAEEPQTARERAKKKEQSSRSSGGFLGGMPDGLHRRAADLHRPARRQKATDPALILPRIFDEIIEEVLLRLPPDEPAGLVRASLMSKAWYAKIYSTPFRQRFPTPPALGFYHHTVTVSLRERCFVSTGASRLPFNMGFTFPRWLALDCRHGRAIFLYLGNDKEDQEKPLALWEPLTRQAQLRMELPVQFGYGLNNPGPTHGCATAAVFCTADGCNHLDCAGHPVGLVFVFSGYNDQDGLSDTYACQYSFPIGKSGFSQNWKSTSIPSERMEFKDHSSVLVGSELFFLSDSLLVLKYDTQTSALSILELAEPLPNGSKLMRTHDNGLGFGVYSDRTLRLSTRVNGQWELSQVIGLESLVPDAALVTMRAAYFAEGSNSVFLVSSDGVFIFDLRSLKAKMVCKKPKSTLIPFVRFYTPVPIAIKKSKEETAGETSGGC